MQGSKIASNPLAGNDSATSGNNSELPNPFLKPAPPPSPTMIPAFFQLLKKTAAKNEK